MLFISQYIQKKLEDTYDRIRHYQTKDGIDVFEHCADYTIPERRFVVRVDDQKYTVDMSVKMKLEEGTESIAEDFPLSEGEWEQSGYTLVIDDNNQLTIKASLHITGTNFSIASFSKHLNILESLTYEIDKHLLYSKHKAKTE